MDSSRATPLESAGWPDTPRLILRRFTIEDAEWAWALDCDPEVMRHISGGVPTPREVFYEELLPRMLRAYPCGPQFGFWTAALRETGQPIGWFHLRPERLEPFAMELGYRLRRDMWGRGLATEGSIELLRRAFSEWEVPRVVALTLTVNAASRRVMEKCGMKWEREFICPESWWPGSTEDQRRAVRYGIDAPQDFGRGPTGSPWALAHGNGSIAAGVAERRLIQATRKESCCRKRGLPLLTTATP